MAREQALLTRGGGPATPRRWRRMRRYLHRSTTEPLRLFVSPSALARTCISSGFQDCHTHVSLLLLSLLVSLLSIILTSMCLIFAAADEAIKQFGHLEPAGVNPLPGMSNGSRLTTEIALRHILSAALVVPRVVCDHPHVETPLLEADSGSVLTVLNWLNTTQVAGPQPLLLSCNASLGFVPATATSVALGPLKKLTGVASHGPGWWELDSTAGPVTIGVRLTVGVADLLMFHK